jgi:hypothetical protein
MMSAAKWMAMRAVRCRRLLQFFIRTRQRSTLVGLCHHHHHQMDRRAGPADQSGIMPLSNCRFGWHQAITVAED